MAAAHFGRNRKPIPIVIEATSNAPPGGEIPPNVDPAEIAKFEAMAARWWDPAGDLRPLHELNPLRVGYIDRRTGLAGCRVLDVGCGGGILAEAMAARGAEVTGIDMAQAPLEVARLHQAESGLGIEYLLTDAESHAAERRSAYDVVTCLELLEHVPKPSGVVAACAALVRPGGQVVFSTINRNPKAFALAIVGAEYLLRLVPRGTHEYRKLIRPSELERWARHAGLELMNTTGIHYNPLLRQFSLGGNVDVNYLMHFERPAAE